MWYKEFMTEFESVEQFAALQYRLFGQDYYDGEGNGTIDTKFVLQQTIDLLNKEYLEGRISSFRDTKVIKVLKERTNMNLQINDDGLLEFAERET